MKIGVIGAGHMGTAMIKGWLNTDQATVAVMNPVNPRVSNFCSEHHLPLFHDAQALTEWQPEVLLFTLLSRHW